jgi:hypothetical protein
MTARLGDIAFLKLARPGVRFHFYDSLQDGIFDTRPDLIVLQTELFREAGLYPVTDARAALRLGIRGQWGGRKAGFDPPDFGDCAERQAPERLDAAVANLRAEFPRFGGLPRSGKRFFERAREEGVFVALLDLPRTATLEAASAGRVGRWRQEVAAALAGSAQLRVLRYDEALADEFFCDFAHLTPRGRDRFVAWFGPELRRLLDASAGGRW